MYFTISVNVYAVYDGVLYRRFIDVFFSPTVGPGEKIITLSISILVIFFKLEPIYCVYPQL